MVHEVDALRFIGRHLVLMASNRWHRFGYACVNFGSPVSLKTYARRRGIDFRKLPKEERFARVEELASELIAAIARSSRPFRCPLVATVFVRDPDRALSELELKAEVYRLMGDLESRGAHVYVPRGDQDYAIDVWLRMLTLRHLVRERDGLFSAEPNELPLLTYYANSIGHLFRQASQTE